MIQRRLVRLLAMCLSWAGLCAVAVCCCAFAVSAQEQSGLSKSAGLAHAGEPRIFAIRGARIVTVSGPAIDKGTVLVTNGIITAVGTDVTIPPAAAVIDGAGLTVYPGLIDAGTTVGLPAAESAG